MASVALFLHRYRPEAISLGETTTAWLRAHGHDVVVVDEGTVSPGADGLASPFDLVVALGGDGTLLRAVSHVLASGAPVLGVNIGRLGYLTQTEPSNLEVALDRFFAGEFTIEERMTVAVSAHDPDGALLASQVVLNEATIEKTVPGHTVRIGAVINNRPFVTYAADGLLLATPTGSTAYNLSARGPILSPRLRAMILTPVSPHMLFDRPLVLEPTETVRLEILEPRDAVLVVDGITVATLAPGSWVTCTEGPLPARLVTVQPYDFHAVLRAKFHLADR